MMIVVTIVAVLLGSWVYRADQQAKTVAAIQALGGDVAYDHQIESSGVGIRNPRLPGPAWLRELIGDRFFLRLRKVSFDQANDETIAKLAQFDLAGVEHLILFGPITNEGFRQINAKAFPKLRRLRIHESQISDEGLAHLNDLNHLTHLYLSYNKVGNQGMRYVAEIRNLAYLDVIETDVDGEGIDLIMQKLPSVTIAK
jgi:hypothetical protein